MALPKEEIERLLRSAETGQMKFMTEKPPKDGRYLGSTSPETRPNFAFTFSDGHWYHTSGIRTENAGSVGSVIRTDQCKRFVWFTQQPELFD